ALCPDGMNAHDVSAVQYGSGVGGGSGKLAVIDRPPGELPEETLARSADHHRMAQPCEPIDPTEDCDRGLGTLGEPQTGVDEDARGRDPRRPGRFDPRRKLLFDLGKDVPIVSAGLHVRWRSTQVAEDHHRIGTGNYLQKVWIEGPTRD